MCLISLIIWFSYNIGYRTDWPRRCMVYTTNLIPSNPSTKLCVFKMGTENLVIVIKFFTNFIIRKDMIGRLAVWWNACKADGIWGVSDDWFQSFVILYDLLKIYDLNTIQFLGVIELADIYLGVVSCFYNNFIPVGLLG